MSEAAERVTKVNQVFINIDTNIFYRSVPRSPVKFEFAANFDCKQNEYIVHYVDKIVNKTFTSHILISSLRMLKLGIGRLIVFIDT